MSNAFAINTNIQSQQAFQNLQGTNDELSQLRERLTTGLRINEASDDAAGFQIANQLEAKTGAQGQALRNIGDAKSALSTAEGALDSQLSILQSAKEKATQAANGSLSQDERDAIAGELTELSQEVDDIQKNAKFNGDQLLNGGSITFQTGAGADNTFEVSSPDSSTSQLGIGGDLDLSTSGADTDSDEAVSVDAGDFGSSVGSGIADEVDDDGTVDGSGTGDVVATTGSDNTLAGNLDGGSFDIKVTNADSSGSNTELTFEVNGSENRQTLDVGTTQKAVTLEEDSSGNQIQLQVSSFLSGTEVSEGESKEFSVSVRDSNDLGSRLKGGTADQARNIIEDVDSAISTVTSNLSDIGAAQNRLSFKESNLETARTNLSAAQSRIEDADFAQTQTQVAKLQVQQQSGTAQLAQANAAGQSVLSLLGG